MEAEILLQGAFHLGQALFQQRGRDVFGNLCQGNVAGGDGDLQAVGDQEHERFSAQLCRQVFGVAGKGEAFALDVFLVDRGGNQRIDEPILEGLRGRRKRGESQSAAFLGFLPGGDHGGVFPQVDDVEFPGDDLSR